MSTLRLDPRALAAAALALFMAGAYVGVMRGESDRPVLWFLALLLLGAAAAVYGARSGASRRHGVLLFAGLDLLGLGVLAIFTIGAPILAAGLLCLSAAGSRKGSASAAV